MEGQLSGISPGADEPGQPNHVSNSNQTNDTEHDTEENRSEQDSQSENVTAHRNQAPSMTPQERIWWAMSFEELYQYAQKKNFGKAGKESRKSGRVKMIKWLCEKEGITPYVAAPSVTPIVSNPAPIAEGSTRAIPHPEATLRTSDPALQRSIKSAETKYREWVSEDLLALAMQRSYQLFKDSKGKLPSRSRAALSYWLAAWDVLKTDREKKWWLGDGIDLVNKAKAMGYQGPSRKYDVIVWLRTTPEESEDVVAAVAEPTPNKLPLKRTADDIAQPFSKRRAKGSTGPPRSKRRQGWELLKPS